LPVGRGKRYQGVTGQVKRGALSANVELALSQGKSFGRVGRHYNEKK